MGKDRRTAVLICDMEGISGIYRRRQCHTGKPEWFRARAGYTEDVAAAAAGFLAGGIGRVVVRDVHDTGYNLHPRRLPRGAVWRPPLRARGRSIYGDFRGVAFAGFVGAHVGAGKEGFFPHTIWGVYARVRLSGRDMDELDLVGGLLAEDGVPVGFVSGEGALVESARARYPWLETARIEKSEAANRGPRRESLWRRQREALFEAARRAASRSNEMRRIVREPPFEFEVEYRDESLAARRAGLWGFERDGARVRWTRPTFIEAYRDFERLTFFSPATDPWRRWLLPLWSAASRVRVIGLRV